MIIHSIVGLIKKTLYKMSQYFPKPYEPFGRDINVKVDLSNLKTKVDKLDIDKLVNVATDLSKLSNVVNNEVVKKTEYDKLVTKVNNIDTGTGKFILKSDYDAYKLELEKKIPDTSNLATKAALTAIENKIPDVSNLVKKVTMTLKLKILKTNILLLLNLIN